MFTLERGGYKCICDGCGAVTYTGQRSFQQAVNVTSREENWEHRRLKGKNWRNYCLRCVEESNVDQDIAGLRFLARASGE
jgi:hypothetical protein